MIFSQPKRLLALQLAVVFRGVCNASSLSLSSSSSTSYVHGLPKCSGGGMSKTRQSRISFKNPFALNMAQDEKDYMSPMRHRPRPEGGDVAYTNENILRQLRYYNNIRQVGGDDCILDVYARDPNPISTDTSIATTTAMHVNEEAEEKQKKNKEQLLIRYWFVGKVARCTGTVSPEQAIARQYNLLEEHACRIRPIELGRYFGTIEMCMAPGNTEVLMAQKDPCVRLQKVPRFVEGADEVALLEVGLNLEIVTNQGVGFCIYRDDDGDVVVPA